MWQYNNDPLCATWCRCTLQNCCISLQIWFYKAVGSNYHRAFKNWHGCSFDFIQWRGRHSSSNNNTPFALYTHCAHKGPLYVNNFRLRVTSVMVGDLLGSQNIWSTLVKVGALGSYYLKARYEMLHVNSIAEWTMNFFVVVEFKNLHQAIGLLSWTCYLDPIITNWLLTVSKNV